MDEYIKREDAISAIIKRCGKPYVQAITNDFYVAVQAVLDVPAADVVEQKHGAWIDMGDFEMCSVCKGTHLKQFQSYYGDVTWIKTDFCPLCAARMDLK